jgi:hypothetical protein
VEFALASWVVLAGVLAPGACLARGLGPFESLLERAVIALAVGRLLLVAATLLAATTGLATWLPLWPAFGVALWVILAGLRRWRRAAAEPGSPALRARLREGGAEAAAVGLVALAAALLAWSVAARSGLAQPGGEIAFFGRHTTSDPLVYAGTAVRLLEAGLPTDAPWAAGLPLAGQLGFLGWLAGLVAVGPLDLLDATFRVRPALDVLGLAVSALALARALGASLPGATAAALVLLLGGDLSPHAHRLLAMLGVTALPLEVWGFGQSFVLALNPIAPGLQTLFAAALLLARPGRGGAGASEERRRALAAGLLVASCFEMKAFLWPPFALGLAAAALRPSAATPIRVAAAGAWGAALPVVAARLLWPSGGGAWAELTPAACIGCFPRFVWEWAFGSHRAPHALFEGAGLATLTDPRAWTAGLAAMAFYAAVHVGARSFALPDLVACARGRGAAGASGGPPPAIADVAYAFGFAALAGLLLAFAVTTPPHPVNAAQFAWSASFALVPALGLPLGRWIAGRAWVRLAGFALLALPAGLLWIAGQGLLAPVFLRVSQDEQILMRALRQHSSPRHVVLDPTPLIDGSRVSPVGWLARRPLLLSLEGMALYLSPSERARRRGLLEAVFAPAPASGALAALRESGARFVFAPAARPLAADVARTLDLVQANAAGAVYRVP